MPDSSKPMTTGEALGLPPLPPGYKATSTVAEGRREHRAWQAVQMYRQGFSIRTIADTLAVGKSTVQRDLVSQLGRVPFGTGKTAKIVPLHRKARR